jgi:hypothetical protein
MIWICYCDCGNSSEVAAYKLKKGNTKSCGCLRKEIRTNFKHGMSYTKKYISDAQRKFSYGIGPEKFDSMRRSQNYGCAICKILESECKKSLCVDHDHKSGKVRGLLCNKCNLLLGKANDNIETLQSSIDYLKRSEP